MREVVTGLRHPEHTSDKSNVLNRSVYNQPGAKICISVAGSLAASDAGPMSDPLKVILWKRSCSDRQKNIGSGYVVASRHGIESETSSFLGIRLDRHAERRSVPIVILARSRRHSRTRRLLALENILRSGHELGFPPLS